MLIRTSVVDSTEFVTFLGKAALSIGIRKSKQNSDALVEATIDKKVLIS